MTIGFLDCYSGVSGDMLLGALVDAGLAVADLNAALAGLSLDGFERVDAAQVMRGPIRATRVNVVTRPGPPHRPFHVVKSLVAAAALDPDVRERSLAVLGRIAEVEGRIHGMPADEVELHEVGAVDSIVDVVGTVAGLALLGVDQLYASPLPMSPGEIRGGHHGPIPGPGPATLELAARAHAPIRPFGDGRELVTPTGAALATMLAVFEQPPMRIERVGYGAGETELAWPNVLRLWLGQPVPGDGEGPPDEHVVLETNVDDMSPQLLPAAVESLYAAGALDVTLAPLLMKKGRPGTLVSVIARASDEARLASILLRETTTLGVRVHSVRRHEAGRAFDEVETPFGPVKIKLKLLEGRVAGAMPEFESVRALAAAVGASVADVHAAAVAAAQARAGETATKARDGS